MRTPGAILIALSLTAGSAFAGQPAECQAVRALVSTEIPMRWVARAIAAKRLDVLVVGAGSSTLPGAEGVSKAYPARLQVALAEKFPGVAVNVATDVRSGRTAVDMVEKLRDVLVAGKPALMVWQTGTVDAIRAADLEQFSSALERGINIARAAGADVIFMNSQYSPRTESIIALGNYAENLRWVALQQDVPLFDRFGIMQLWSELRVFDFHTMTKKLDMAARVHDCIGRLLADLIAEGANAAAPPGGGR